MMISFYVVVALALAVQAADIYTTNMFLRRGVKEGFALTQWFLDTFGAYWFLPKLAIAFASIGLCGYIAVSYSPIVAAILLLLPTLFVATVGVYQNYQRLR